MATTTIDLNNPLSMKVWSKKIMAEVSKATSIAPLIGVGKNNIIELKEEIQKGAGDTVSFGLRMQLSGGGVSENEILEGHEESLTLCSDSLRIGELAHAVRIRNEGTIDQQRIPYSLRNEAKESLVDWYADRLALTAFIHFCGYTGNSLPGRPDRIMSSQGVYTGFNTPKAPSSNRIIYPNNKFSEATLDKKDYFTLKLIDRAVEMAKLANPAIRPVRIGGDNAYVLYLHPSQVTSLRSNTETGQWLDIQKSAYNGSRRNNPIFDGSLGMYNGVILRESPYITPGLTDLGEQIPQVRRAVLLGAQAGVIAFGQNQSATRFKLVEELFDYQRELGIAAKTLIGMKKTSFTSSREHTGGEQERQDFATIVIPTYVEAR